MAACFCAATRPFTSSVDIALVVHPYEVSSTIGTAWILRRSISNIHWFRSKGVGLDTDPTFLKMLNSPELNPLLLFPGPNAFNLSLDSSEAWSVLNPPAKRPLFIVIDGTWTQAKAMLRQSSILSALPRVSFETTRLSEYGFKKQPKPACLSSVESVHHMMEVLASRTWAKLPMLGEHDQMLEIFRGMVKFQLAQKRNLRRKTALLNPKNRLND